MVQDPRETQLEVTPTNRVAIFYENGGPDKISIKQLDNIKPSELNAGEVLVRVSQRLLRGARFGCGAGITNHEY